MPQGPGNCAKSRLRTASTADRSAAGARLGVAPSGWTRHPAPAAGRMTKSATPCCKRLMHDKVGYAIAQIFLAKNLSERPRPNF